MTLATIHDLHRSSRARMSEREAQDAARAHLEQCRSLPDITDEWWGEQEPADLFCHEIQMVADAILNQPDDLADHARRFRRTAYLDSAECETLIDDMAAGAKEWPR